MTALQVYSYLSTVMFVLLGVMLNGDHPVSLVLKALCWVLAIFGLIVSLAASGVLLSGNIRLV